MKLIVDISVIDIEVQLRKTVQTEALLFTETRAGIASLQTSFGVRLSRIHFSPTDVC